VRFFSEIQYGDPQGKNSQQDAGTIRNKAPLLRDMKNGHPGENNLNLLFPNNKG